MENIYKELEGFIKYPYSVDIYDYDFAVTIFRNENGKICDAITNKLINKLSEFGTFDYVIFKDDKWKIYFKKN